MILIQFNRKFIQFPSVRFPLTGLLAIDILSGVSTSLDIEYILVDVLFGFDGLTMALWVPNEIPVLCSIPKMCPCIEIRFSGNVVKTFKLLPLPSAIKEVLKHSMSN